MGDEWQASTVHERWNEAWDLRKTTSVGGEADSQDKRSYPNSSKSFTKGRTPNAEIRTYLDYTTLIIQH
jgi:hypothetical protein